MTKNSSEAVKKTTNKSTKTADDTGTRSAIRDNSITTIREHQQQQQQQQQQTIKQLDKEYVNETHVADFANALAHDPNHEHITAWTDALPAVRSTNDKKILKRSKRKLKEQEAAKPKGFTHSLLQFPLIGFIGFIIFMELVAYISLRQIVRIWENAISWRGQKRRLRNELRASKTYRDWCEAADALDKHMHKDEWKNTIPYAYYDYRLLQKVVKHLRIHRQGNTLEDATKLMDVLYVCLKQNFAGIENEKLYSNTYLGTKRLIEEYVEEVTKSIDALAHNKHITAEEKRVAFRLYSKNYGRTAFCLSGGAGFGYYHLGVIRALLDRGLLPSIMTGTSAGSLMGAIVCTRTDEELNEILTPELAKRIRICQESWPKKILRFVRSGSLFDAEQWCREAMWFCKGSITFKEAYEKTGRIFNVSVIPYDPHSPPKLLNYITAPDCVIWSAVLASAAIPGILNPVVLMQKKRGSAHLVPYNYGHKFKDGSLSTDIPTLALNTQFNVNYTIVSQVNPHVHLFFYANQGSPGRPVTHLQGRGWRGGFIASSLEQFLILDMFKWLKLMRSLKLLPKINDQDWSNVWLQKFDGNVTILPKSHLSDWLYTIADPSEERLRKLMNSGQLRTWPKVSMISNRMRIESAIEKVRKSLRSSSRREDRNRKQQHNTADVLNNKLNVALSDEYGNSNNSDAGSGDELMFMARRRLSMPNGSLSSHQSSDQLPNSITDKELLHEQKKRRRFMAQFSQSPQRDLVDKTSNNSSSHTLLSSGSTARRASMSNGKSQPPTATPAIIVSGGSAFTASDAYLSSDSSSSFEPGDDDDAL